MKTIKIDEIEYVNVQDLSEELEVSYKTIYDKLNGSGINYIYLGKNKYFELTGCADIISYYTSRNNIRRDMKK